MRARQYRLDVGPLQLPAGPRVRLLLRRGPGGGLRLRDPAQVPRPAAVSGGRDHPQPARQREAARHGGPSSSPAATDGSSISPAIAAEDVVIMPAFGVTIGDFERLRAIGCVLVDTTCGSVLNVWKRVESYARDGYTAHDPRQALSRGDQGHREPGHEVSGRPLPRGAQHGRGADRLRLHRARRRRRRRWPSASRKAVSPGFDFDARSDAGGHREPDDDALGRVAGDRGGGPAQHGAALRRRGAWRITSGSFDTICSATQERQDAVLSTHPGAARRDGRGGRLQLQQHLPPRGAGAVEGRAHLPHRGRRTAWIRPRAPSATSRSAPSTRSTTAGWLGGRPHHRHHRRRLDAEQQGRRDDRPDLRAGRRRRGAARARPGEPAPDDASSISATPSSTA